MDLHIFLAVEGYWKKLGYRTVLFYAYFLTVSRKGNEDIAPRLRQTVSVDEKFPGVVRKLVSEGFMNPDNHTLTPSAIDAVQQLIIDSLGTDKPVLNNSIIAERGGAPDVQKHWVDKGSEYLIKLMERIPGVKTYPGNIADRRGRFVKVYRHAQEPALLFWFLNIQRLANNDFDLLFLLRNHADALAEEPWKELGGASPSKVIPIAAAPTYGERIVATAPECGNRLIGPINLEAMGHQINLEGKLTQSHYNALTDFLKPSRGGIIDGTALGRFFELYFRKQNEYGAT